MVFQMKFLEVILKELGYLSYILSLYSKMRRKLIIFLTFFTTVVQ